MCVQDPASSSAGKGKEAIRLLYTSAKKEIKKVEPSCLTEGIYIYIYIYIIYIICIYIYILSY